MNLAREFTYVNNMLTNRGGRPWQPAWKLAERSTVFMYLNIGHDTEPLPRDILPVAAYRTTFDGRQCRTFDDKE